MTISPKTRFLFGGLASIALVITIAAALAITRCSDEEGTTGNSSDARLVKVVGHYNIVKFNGNVYGVPHGVAIDWEKDDLKKVDGMIVGTSVDLVEKSIRSLPPPKASVGASPDAHLIKVVGHYNIVKFNGNVYGAPHGVAIDWEKDDLKKVDGMIIGSSVVLVQVSIVGRLMSEKVSRLIKKVSRLTGRKTI
jgi:hypothetical protein